MEMMNQPFDGQLGHRLIELLESGDYHTLNIAVAFAKNSGVLRLKDSFERFRRQGGTVNAYVGVDLGGTSYEALTALLLHTDSLNVVHSEKAQTFHVKIYHFLGKEKGLIVVGSNNMTGGGLWTNFESSMILSVSGSSSNEIKLLKQLQDYIGNLTSLKDSLMPINVQDDIDKLLEAKYVFKEIAEQVRLAKIAAEGGFRKRLFGNGVPAKLPHVAMPQKEKRLAIPLVPAKPIVGTPTSEGQTIWFETRSMTGGSRNILDLSKKSLVERGDPKGTPFDLGDPRFMRGGVEFFGLNPSATDQTKDISLNFEGIDYIGNTILFPIGDNANGTWRLQIKGTSSSGFKITEAFRARGTVDYLVKKIITFTKIQADYYFMSVFADSDIESFKAASRILARNGSTRNAKQLGLL
jgi:HKD family nuclease